jgi:hypothetical protein
VKQITAGWAQAQFRRLRKLNRGITGSLLP